MSNRVMAMVVAGSLLLSASGSALAAGSKGTIGGDQFRTGRPALAGKMGGSADGLGASQISCHEEVLDGDSAEEADWLERLGGKLGVGTGGD